MKILLNVLVVVIGFGGVVAVATDGIILAITMLTMSVLWLGFFIVMNFAVIADAVIDKIMTRADEIWSSVYERYLKGY